MTKFDSSLIFEYSREDAIADGALMDVTEFVKPLGVKVSTVLTRELACLVLTGEVGQLPLKAPSPEQVESGSSRMVALLRRVPPTLKAMFEGQPPDSEADLPMEKTINTLLSFRTASETIPMLQVKLVVNMEPLASGDAPAPTITLMLPSES